MNTLVRLFVAAAITIGFLALPTPAVAWWKRDCRSFSHFTGQTSMVADINPGAADAVDILFGFSQRNEFLGTYQGKLFFQADDGQSGAELWRVEAGVASQVQDLVPGPGGSAPHSFVEFQGKLYFAATTPATGEELFSFDGTTLAVAAEAEPGPAGGAIRALTAYDGALYFTRRGQVWRFSGGTVQPVPAINNAPGWIDNDSSVPAPFVAFGGRLWYVRVTPLPERYELWAFDGTSAVKVKALNPISTPPDDLGDFSFRLGVYRGALYFGVVVPGSFPFSKDELWRVDAQGSPTKVADLPGNANSFSQPSDFTVYKGKLYFLGSNFYRWDGSSVQGLSPGIGVVGKMTPFTKADRLFLSGITGGWEGAEPYLYDGNGVALLQNIMPDTPEPHPPYPGTFPTSGMEAADGFYFFAADQEHGRELWRIAGEATWTY
jgi:ELWxxDGT repeat protein